MPQGSNNLEMILALLAKVILFYMRISIKNVRISAFERPVEIFLVCLVVKSLIDTYFNELSEQHVGGIWLRGGLRAWKEFKT